MAASPPTRTRLTAAICSGLIAFALAGYPALAVDRSTALILLLGVTALVLLCVGLIQRSNALVGASVATIALQYISYLHIVHERLSQTTPLYAASLVLLSELADTSISADPKLDTSKTIKARFATVIATALVTVAVTGALVLGVRQVTLKGPSIGPIGLLTVSAIVIIIVALAPATHRTE